MAELENEIKEETQTENENYKASWKKKLEKKDQEINELKGNVEHWKNEYYRLYADMDNLRKDIKKDHSEALKYRIEGFVSELLQVLDSFEIALKNEPNSEETKNYLIGFQFVQTSLLNILSNEGVQIIEPKIGQKFDETDMEAVDFIESENEEENLIKKVNLKGYKLHSHLIRPALVVVSKKPAKVEEKTENISENA